MQTSTMYGDIMENQHTNLAKSRIPPTVLTKMELLLLDFNMSTVSAFHSS